MCLINNDMIELVSRRGTVNSYLLRLDDKMYAWYTSSDNITYQITHSEDDEDEIFILDPEDGPAVTIGSRVGEMEVCRIRRTRVNGSDSQYVVYFR